jgi:hypothetical protein
MLSTHGNTAASSPRTRPGAAEHAPAQPRWQAMARVGKAALLAGFAILSGGHSLAAQAADGPFLKNGAANERNVRHGSFYARSQNCADVFTPLIPNTWCARTSADPVVALIGDSHAGQMYLGVRDSGDPIFRKAIYMGAGSCYPTVGLDSREGCGKQLDLAFKIADTTKSIRYVVIGGYYGWSIHVQDAAGAASFINGYRKTIEHFLSTGKHVVFLIDNPALGFDSDACLARKRPIGKALGRITSKEPVCPGEYTTNLADQSRYRTFMSELVAAYPNVLFYDPKKKLCPEGPCRIIKDGLLLYSDDNHLSQYGSAYVAEDLVQQMKSRWE